MADASLTVGELARRADLNPSAIRYYERIGVLPAPERVSGQRRYGDADLRRVGLLTAAKRAGFSLDETRLLLAADADGTPGHTHIKALAARKLPEVEALIEHALVIRGLLRDAATCDADSLEDCTVLRRA